MVGNVFSILSKEGGGDGGREGGGLILFLVLVFAGRVRVNRLPGFLLPSPKVMEERERKNKNAAGH